MRFGRRIASSWVLWVALVPACKDEPSLLDAYLALGDELARDQVAELEPRSTTIVRAAEPKQGEPGVAAIVEGARRLGGQDLEAARAAFEGVSTGMIEHLRAHPEQRTGHMLVHCPMTFEGKGALWVQRSGKVMNPYEGARMLHCGDKLDWDAEPPPR